MGARVRRVSKARTGVRRPLTGPRWNCKTVSSVDDPHRDGGAALPTCEDLELMRKKRGVERGWVARRGLRAVIELDDVQCTAAQSAPSVDKCMVGRKPGRGGRATTWLPPPRSPRCAGPAMAADLSVPLNELISTKLGALSLRDDEEMVDFVKGLVEEESFEPEVCPRLCGWPGLQLTLCDPQDRKSAILGMLEADEEDGSFSSSLLSSRSGVRLRL